MEVKTYLRIRPLQLTGKNFFGFSEDRKNFILKDLGSQNAAQRRKSIGGQQTESEFHFDGVFDMDISQNDLFQETCQPIIDDALYKSTCTALIGQGETKSGKTFTIFGSENIQQEEFSIDQSDPKDTRGLVLKAIHYIFKKGKNEGKNVTLECQMLDLYLDTLRDLSKGKTNKFNKASLSSALYERDKEVELEELQNGETILTNLQTVKIQNPKEAATFIEKCLDYQKKLEKDTGTFTSLTHTIFILNVSFGMDVKSQIYFIDLGSSERSEGKKLKEAFVVQGNIIAFNKYLADFQSLMSEDEKDLYQFKEFKLTYLLKNIFKDYQKISIISHLYLNEQNISACLRTLEINEKIKSSSLENNAQKKCNSVSLNSHSHIEEEEHNVDQIIQNLNKDNFELRNSIEAMKRSHKIKMEELQQLLNIPCDIDFLLKNKDTAPQIVQIHEQRKALEKADSLIKSNKEFEKKIDFLTFDLQELKKDKKIQQETFSQQFIALNQEIESLREEKEGFKMNLENNLRMQKAYSQVEIKNINQTATNMLGVHSQISKQIQKNAIFAKEENENDDIRLELDDIKEKGFQDNVVKFNRLFQLQLKTQEKEISRVKEQQNAQSKAKDELKVKMAKTFQKYKLKKEQEMKESNDELVKMYEVAIKQDQVTQGLIRGDYSGSNYSTKVPEKDLVHLPNPQNFPKLHQELEQLREKGCSTFKINKRPSTSVMNTMQQTMKTTQYFEKTIDNKTTLQASSQNADNHAVQKELMTESTTNMEYSQLRSFITSIQSEFKRLKQNPLNPDNIRVEKIKELMSERDRYKDLYVSESIKNKEFQQQQQYEQTDRNLKSQGGHRPMTTMSSVSSFKQSIGMGGGGFFVTQLRPGSRVRAAQLISSQSQKRLPYQY